MGFLSEALSGKLIGRRTRDALSGEPMGERFFCRTCRLLVGSNGENGKYRITFAIRARSYAEAEEHSDTCLEKIIQDRRPEFQSDLSIRWLKARVIGNDVAGENEVVKTLLSRLRRDSANILFEIESRATVDQGVEGGPIIG